MQQTTYLNEVLLRFDENGLVAAHQVHNAKYTEGGETLFEKAGEAQPLGSDAIAGLMDDQIPAMAAKIDALTKAVADRDAKIDALTKAK